MTRSEWRGVTILQEPGTTRLEKNSWGGPPQLFFSNLLVQTRRLIILIQPSSPLPVNDTYDKLTNSVAGRDSATSVIEAQEPQSRSSKVVNCTFLGEICGEIEVAKVFRSNIWDIVNLS